ASTRPRQISLEGLEKCFARDWMPMRGMVFAEAVDDPNQSAQLPPIQRTLTGLGGNALVSLEAYPGAYFAELAVTLQWRRLCHELRGHRNLYGRPVPRIVRQRIVQPILDLIGPTPPNRKREIVGQYLNPDFV